MKKILFFNGWGMDNNSIPPDYDGYIINYPYTLPKNLNLSSLEEYTAIGFSFGAYYLAKLLKENPHLKFKKTIFINGHGEMMGKFGIKEKMVDFTLKNLTKESLMDFYKNMNLPQDKKNTTNTLDEIKEELAYFKKSYKPIDIFPNVMIISQKDKIISSKNMKKYVDTYNVQGQYIDRSHYPFILSFYEILKEVL